MDYLLINGNYKDYSELVAVAIENLCVITKEFEISESSIINDNSKLLLNKLKLHSNE